MFELNPYLLSRQNIVNSALVSYLDSSCFKNCRITDAMSYSVMAGGKRIRPILCLAASDAIGGIFENALPAACALEFIHTYSLVHDDLPAMDNDALRRGKPTCHIKFDEATAILAGDALLTLAFDVMAGSYSSASDAERRLKVIDLISKASGRQGMIEGQMQDILSENLQVSFDTLETIHKLKTGALIIASVKAGAILAGAQQDEIERLTTYSENIGLAFQVSDDILNVEGDPEIMGKAVGTDQDLNKATYPSLLGLDKSKQLARDLVSEACDNLDIFDKKADPLRAIAKYIAKRKH